MGGVWALLTTVSYTGIVSCFVGIWLIFALVPQKSFFTIK
jgi:hypothetical protein